MSHSTGAVRFKDGLILWLEYNGTIDVVLPKLRATREELTVNWRQLNWAVCSNPKEHEEDVELCVTYGGGYIWEAKACRQCMAVIGPLAPHENENQGTIDDISEWYPNRQDYIEP